jgi:hypothetical protein
MDSPDTKQSIFSPGASSLRLDATPLPLPFSPPPSGESKSQTLQRSLDKLFVLEREKAELQSRLRAALRDNDESMSRVMYAEQEKNDLKARMASLEGKASMSIIFCSVVHHKNPLTYTKPLQRFVR